jgi:hypothetical protein
MQINNPDSSYLLLVIGFCMAVGIASVGAADYLSRLANKHNLKITARMVQIFGFVIIGCNIVQLTFLMLNPRSVASESSTDSSDVQYRSDDGGYSITFSGTPEEQTMQQQFGDVSMTMHEAILHKDHPRWAYTVCYMDTGRDIPIDDIESGMLRAMTGSLGDLQSTKEITVDGETGKEYLFRPGSAFVRCRVFSHAHRMYVVVDGGPQDQEDAYDDLHFADSFHFTQ